MTKRSQGTMQAICETIASGNMSYKGAAAVNGVSQSTFWGWIKASQADDPYFIIEWLGERVQFARAINAARKIGLYEIRSALEMRAAMGTTEAIYFQGQPTWVELEEAVGLDPDVRELLGYPRDGLKRDENGFRIQHSIRHAPPVQLVLRVAEMAFKAYRPGSTLEVNGAVSLGVTTISRKQTAATPLAPPPVPLLAVLPDPVAVDEPLDAVTDDRDDAADPDDIAVRDTPPVVYSDAVTAGPQAPPAAVVIADAPTARERPAPPSPFMAPQSDLVADLMARARAKGALPPTTDRRRDA